jgi:hypothetical protein
LILVTTKNTCDLEIAYHGFDLLCSGLSQESQVEQIDKALCLFGLFLLIDAVLFFIFLFFLSDLVELLCVAFVLIVLAYEELVLALVRFLLFLLFFVNFLLWFVDYFLTLRCDFCHFVGLLIFI